MLPSISLLAVGDVMLARTVGERIAQGEADYPFEHVAEMLRSADVAVAVTAQPPLPGD